MDSMASALQDAAAWPLRTAECGCMAHRRNSVQIPSPPSMGNLFSFTGIITGAGEKDGKQATFPIAIKNPRGDINIWQMEKAKPSRKKLCFLFQVVSTGLHRDAQGSLTALGQCTPCMNLFFSSWI